MEHLKVTVEHLKVKDIPVEHLKVTVDIKIFPR